MEGTYDRHVSDLKRRVLALEKEVGDSSDSDYFTILGRLRDIERRLDELEHPRNPMED